MVELSEIEKYLLSGAVGYINICSRRAEVTSAWNTTSLNVETDVHMKQTWATIRIYNRSCSERIGK